MRRLIAALATSVFAATAALAAVPASAADEDSSSRAAQSWYTVHKALRTKTQACRYAREGTVGIDVRSKNRANSPRRVSVQTVNTKYDDTWAGDRILINPRQTREWYTGFFFEGDYTLEEQLVRFKISTRKGRAEWTDARTWGSIPPC